MKLKTLLLTTALVASSVAFADAPAPSRASKGQSDKYYAKIEAGITMPEVKISSIKGKFDNSFTGGIGGGYIFNEFFRTDLMVQYRNLKAGKGSDNSVDYYSGLLNGYLTAHNDTIFTPYLMAGAGIGAFSKKSYTSDIEFAWNAGVGCQAKVLDQVNIDLAYRYAHLSNKNKIDIYAHEVLAGLVYSF